MRNNSAIFLCLSMMTSLFTLELAYADIGVHFEAFNAPFSFNFDKPRGTVSGYSENRTMIFINAENATVTVSNLVASTDIAGFSVAMHQTSFQIPGEEEVLIGATFTAGPNMTEGTHTGRFIITGSGVNYNSSMRVRITWPKPALAANWDTNNWGDLPAGSEINRTFVIKETVGYHPVPDVALALDARGPVLVGFEGSLGNISPYETRNVTVNLKTPETGLPPGTYRVDPRLSAGGNTSVRVEDATYTIQEPKFSVDKSSINFGSITFETGKDSALDSVTLRESGGYTPVEGIALDLSLGEVGWITHSYLDYLAPNSSVPIVFLLRLPPEASLGEKAWEFQLNTTYSGTHKIRVRASVYFPGIEDAIKIVKISANIPEVNESQTILNNSLLLLQNSRGKTDIGEIAQVVSIYSGSLSLINLIREAREARSQDLDKAGATIVLAKSALNKIKIGNYNIKDPELRTFSSEILSAADEMWNIHALDIVGIIGDLARTNERENYKRATIFFKRGAEIYTLLGEKTAEEFRIKQIAMESKYKDSIEEAAKLERDGGIELSTARAKMFNIGDFYLLLNPFSYEEARNNYNNAIAKYMEAVELYRIAGEQGNSELLSRELEKVLRQERIFRTAFIIYGFSLTAVFFFFIARVTLGLQYFREDDSDTDIGEVVLPEKFS